MSPATKRQISTKLDKVFDLLTEYLTDNTEEVFEEIPEVDDARGEIIEIQELMAE